MLFRVSVEEATVEKNVQRGFRESHVVIFRLSKKMLSVSYILVVGSECSYSLCVAKLRKHGFKFC